MYHRMAMYERAADAYEEYADASPRGENVRNALANASQFRQGLERTWRRSRPTARISASDDDDEEELQGIAEATYQQGLIELRRSPAERGVSFRGLVRRYSTALPSRA